jgi:hypothetical protein
LVNKGNNLTTKASQTINLHADSLIDLLVAQCADLEALLKLARQESAAAEANDFDRMLEVTTQRATLGERLESYHRQISELRALMGDSAEHVLQSTLVKDSIRLALEIQGNDAATSTSLTHLRAYTNSHISRLDQGRRSSTAYLNEARVAGIKCDRRA